MNNFEGLSVNFMLRLFLLWLKYNVFGILDV